MSGDALDNLADPLISMTRQVRTAHDHAIRASLEHVPRGSEIDLPRFVWVVPEARLEVELFGRRQQTGGFFWSPKRPGEEVTVVDLRGRVDLAVRQHPTAGPRQHVTYATYLPSFVDLGRPSAALADVEAKAKPNESMRVRGAEGRWLLLVDDTRIMIERNGQTSGPHKPKGSAFNQALVDCWLAIAASADAGPSRLPRLEISPAPPGRGPLRILIEQAIFARAQIDANADPSLLPLDLGRFDLDAEIRLDRDGQLASSPSDEAVVTTVKLTLENDAFETWMYPPTTIAPPRKRDALIRTLAHTDAIAELEKALDDDDPTLDVNIVETFVRSASKWPSAALCIERDRSHERWAMVLTGLDSRTSLERHLLLVASFERDADGEVTNAHDLRPAWTNNTRTEAIGREFMRAVPLLSAWDLAVRPV